MKKGQKYKLTVLKSSIEVIQATKNLSQKFVLTSGQNLTGIFRMSTVSGYNCFQVDEIGDEVFFPPFSVKTEVVP